MRAIARVLGKLAAFAVTAGVAAVLYMTGSNVVDYFRAGPWTPSDQAQAAMAKLANVNLETMTGSISYLREVLGEPEHVEHSDSEINVQQYRWYRGAIRIRAAGDLPIRIEVGNTRWFEILPFGRPDFPGNFFDLKIGGPAPSIAAAALHKHAAACCEAALFEWGESGGHVSWIDYQRKVLRLRGY